MKIKALLFALVLATPSVAMAEDPAAGADQDTAQPAAKTKISDAEKDILGHAHQVNIQEIELGKLAERQGTAEVKNYGKMLANEHQADDRKLMQLAKENGIKKLSKPAKMSEQDKQNEQQDKQAMAQLRKAKGQDFDRQFLQLMVQQHERELAMTTPMMATIQNEKIQSYLRDHKDMLQKHHDRAQELLGNTPQARGDQQPPQQPQQPQPEQQPQQPGA